MYTELYGCTSNYPSIIVFSVIRVKKMFKEVIVRRNAVYLPMRAF